MSAKMNVNALTGLVPPRIRAAKGALLAWYDGEPELRILPHVCARDEIAIDVGANRGVYTWHFLRLTRNVIAFEPNPKMAHFLKLAFGARVHIEEVALSDARGTATLRIPADLMQSGCATIEEANPLTGDSTEVRVLRRRLDEYDFDRVSIIKIDVEGHELAVLKGGAALLARDLPTLIVEAEERHREGALKSVSDYLAQFGYRGFFVREGRVGRLDEVTIESSLHMKSANQRIYNFIFAARAEAIGRLLDAR